MNPIAHMTLGVHIANVGFYQRYGRRATLILAAASLFPDIDSVTLFISRDATAIPSGVHPLARRLGTCGGILALLTARRDLKRWFFIDWGLWALGMMGIPQPTSSPDGRSPYCIRSPTRAGHGHRVRGDGFLTGTWLGLAVAADIFTYRRAISAGALIIGLLYLSYDQITPSPGPSWLSTLWFGFWMGLIMYYNGLPSGAPHMTIYTVGHSNIAIERFVDILRLHMIQVLADTQANRQPVRPAI